MADLVIEMYSQIVESGNDDIPVPAGHLGNLVIETIGATAQRTSADFKSGTKFINISTDDTADVFFKLGDETVIATTDATGGSRPLRGGDSLRAIGIDGHTRLSVIK